MVFRCVFDKKDCSEKVRREEKLEMCAQRRVEYQSLTFELRNKIKK